MMYFLKVGSHKSRNSQNIIISEENLRKNAFKY